MMILIYKADGSIRMTDFTEFIQQGNNGVNKIFVSIEGKETSEYEASALFTLPDSTVTVLAGEATTEPVEFLNQPYDGYVFTLSQNETKYAGIVYLTIQLTAAGSDEVLRTYRVPLTINKSVSDLDETLITMAQYQNLLRYIEDGLAGAGIYFTPSMTEGGDLSWTNNGGLENPATVNLKGPKGDDGTPYSLYEFDGTATLSDILGIEGIIDDKPFLLHYHGTSVASGTEGYYFARIHAITGTNNAIIEIIESVGLKRYKAQTAVTTTLAEVFTQTYENDLIDQENILPYFRFSYDDVITTRMAETGGSSAKTFIMELTGGIAWTLIGTWRTAGHDIIFEFESTSNEARWSGSIVYDGGTPITIADIINDTYREDYLILNKPSDPTKNYICKWNGTTQKAEWEEII